MNESIYEDENVLLAVSHVADYLMQLLQEKEQHEPQQDDE